MTIQQRLNNKRKWNEKDSIKRTFVRERSQGNNKAALHLFSKDNRGSFLRLSDTILTANDEHASVLDVLKSKQPPVHHNLRSPSWKEHTSPLQFVSFLTALLARTFALLHSAPVTQLALLVLMHKLEEIVLLF